MTDPGKKTKKFVWNLEDIVVDNEEKAGPKKADSGKPPK